MKLWLVRHARPLIEAGRCYGASDVPADEAATLACAQALARELPPGIGVMSSPLLRCAALARHLHALRPDLRPVQDARLAEMDFGCWEGRRWDAIPKTAFDAWTDDFGAHRFGGRESVNDLMQRVAAVHAQTLEAGAPAVWITHAGVIRGMALLARGVTCIARADQWPQQAPGWGEWQVLAF